MNDTIAWEVARTLEALKKYWRIESPVISGAIESLAEQVAAIATDQALMDLMSVEEVAQHYNVTPRVIQARAVRLNDAGYPVGRQIGKGKTWVFHRRELERLAPLPAHRPRKSFKDVGEIPY